MRIAFIETNAITNEVLRAYADAHPLCAGYPDGVPETWRTVSAAQQEGGEMPDLPMKHFTDETRARIEAREQAARAQMCPTCGGAGGGAVTPESFAEWLATPDAPPVRVSGNGFRVPAYAHDPSTLGKCGATYPEHELDPAALLGPAGEPVTYADLPPGDAVQFAADVVRVMIDDWPARDSAGDEEC